MQRVSMQLCRALEKREDVMLDTIILQAPWKGIALRTAGFLGSLVLMLPKRAKKFGADIILFSSMVTASTALLVRKRISIPMVTIVHGKDVTLPSTPYQWIVPNVFQRLDGVITVSTATKKECEKRGFREGFIRALGNGFEEKDSGVYPSRVEARRQIAEDWGLDGEQKYLLLTVGRLVKRKGHERFIRRILPSIEAPVHYLIIGDGPEIPAVSRAIEETGQSDRVTLAGRQPDAVLRNAYAASDLFIMPNIPVDGDMEGFGIVVLEANLANTPVIASDLEGIKDVVQNDVNGYRIEVDNDEAFVQKIEEFLSNNHRKKQGEKARQYVMNHFSWKHIAGEYVKFLRSIVKRTHIA